MNDATATKTRQAYLPLVFDGTTNPAKSVLFLILCAAWLIPGLVGHDPWKFDDAVTLGVVHDMLRGADWVVPTIAGEPYVVKPPLYDVTSAMLASVFAGLFPLHDAARLATGLYMALTLLFTGLSAVALFGSRFARVTVLILIGSIGLVIRAHEMNSDIAALAGYAMALYGLALSRTRALLAGALLGTGAGIGAMSRGLVAPGMIAIIALLLPVMFSAWRTRTYFSCLVTALAAVLPWLILWPVALYTRAPELFSEWLWVHNLGWIWNYRRLAEVNPTFYVGTLTWYAWPALPLALWTLWQGGARALQQPQYQLPLLTFAVFVAVLSISPAPKEAYAMPLLLPIVLLAGAGIDTLRRGAASALDWFGMMTFGLFSALMWFGWFAMLTGKPVFIIRRLDDFRPGFHSEFNSIAFAIALTVCLLWVITVTRARRTNRRAIVNWSAGITMFWVLAMTLWLPFVDSGRSYRSMIESLHQAVPAQYTCMASRGVGLPQRALLDYFANIRTKRADTGDASGCDLLLTQGSTHDRDVAGPGWRLIWEGGRPGDRIERYRLYERT
jgi:4-amino-4-deoxy-L-arabinose transferase-like glycosyltransferase